MKAKNIYADNLEKLVLQYSTAVEDGFRPTLAIVFCSVFQDRGAVSDFLSQKDIAVFGSTTAGEILDNEVFENSMVTMLLDIKKEDFTIYFREDTDTYKIANELAFFAKQTFANSSVMVISSGLTVDAEMILKGVQDADPEIPLFGGLAGDDLTMKNSYVFTNGKSSSNGLVGLIFNNDKINVKGLATSGWDNIGIEKTVTRSEGNVVYSIDGKPAADVFVKYFQFNESVDTKAEIIAMNFAQYPLQLKKENGNTVLRAPMMVDKENHALIFAGGIPQGSKVKFSVPPGFDLIEKTAARVAVLKEQVPDADAVIMFSCKARHLALGPLTENEASLIRGIWDKPLIGFFTYGEIGTAANSVCDFHNETCSMVIIAEK